MGLELNKMVKDLLDSDILENKVLGTSLLGSPEISSEERRKHIARFIADYKKDPLSFMTDDNKHLYKNWVELLLSEEDKYIKERVKDIQHGF